jgi:hypothetical protein
MKPQDRRPHAEAQRKYAKLQREQRIPRRVDLALALLEAARRDVARNQSVNIERADADLWRRLMTDALEVLRERRFDNRRSRERMMRVLRPVPGAPTGNADAEEGPVAIGSETLISD